MIGGGVWYFYLTRVFSMLTMLVSVESLVQCLITMYPLDTIRVLATFHLFISTVILMESNRT